MSDSWEGNHRLHWPCIKDSSGLFTYGLKVFSKGDEHSAYILHIVWHCLPLPLFCSGYLRFTWKSATKTDERDG